MNRPLLAAALALTLLSGCVERPEPASPADVPAKEAFRDRLLEIAGEYERAYAAVHAATDWALADCVMPPVTPGFSRSGDAATHGRKLAYYFVKRGPDGGSIKGYVAKDGPNPVGQAVVKEAWVPEEIDGRGPLPGPVTRTRKVRADGKGLEQKVRFVPYAWRGDKLYRAKEKAGLFVMYKVDPATPGTDEGWVYGTVTADGKAVTSAGRVASCMGCHRKAPYDRLFGVDDR
jgi:hypothetical protein